MVSKYQVHDTYGKTGPQVLENIPICVFMN